MLKVNKKTMIITSIVILLPIVIGLIFWKRLPDVMATHFGTDNEANGFSSKIVAVFGLPLFMLLIHWVAVIVTSHDPRKQNISPKMFSLVVWLVPAISLFASVSLYSYNLGYQVDITFVSEILMSAMLIIIGNYLPKARQNYTIGIKIPWTLADEENWNRTHRMAGYLWMVSGIIMMILTLCRALYPKWMIGLFLIIGIGPCFYSFWLYTKKSD